MARFYGEIQGNRGGASRVGNKDSGINGHLRGWDIGAAVDVSPLADIDTVDVFLTTGSNGGGSRVHLAQAVRDGKGYKFTGGLVADLLAALERIANSEPRPNRSGDFPAHEIEAMQRTARAAIAKARGE